MAFDSLFIGDTGLAAYQQQIDVISNNIANVGTTGYKDQQVTFQDLLYQNQTFASAPTNTNGGVDAQQVGDGVKVGSITSIFSQGGLQTTGVNTDLAIDGNGFFVLNNTSGTGAAVYTRDGAFSINEAGLLYDPSSGQAVMGYAPTVNGITNNTPAPIQIPLGLKSAAVATGATTAAKSGPTGDQVFDATLGGNLNQANYITAQQSGGANVTYTTISTTFYDSLGGGHLVDITFQPATSFAEASPVGAASVKGVPITPGAPVLVTNAAGVAVTAATEWAYTITPTDGSTFINPATGLPAAAGTPILGGYIYFDQNGQYINTVSDANGDVVAAGYAPQGHIAGGAPSYVTGDQLGVSVWQPTGADNAATTANGLPGSSIGLDFSDLTALSEAATANVVSQDGYPPGSLSNISIGQNGEISGSFTNGQVTSLGTVALATFSNEQGLELLGSNQYTASANSGLAQYGTPNTGSLGSIVSGSLEQSNVVIANEFTNMILAQRAFEANSRSIDVGDQDLQTVIQMQQNG